MQGAYPELKDSAERVAKVVEAEEGQFARVLEKGSQEWNQLIIQKINENFNKEYEFRSEIEKAAPPDIAEQMRVTTAAMLDMSKPALETEEAITKIYSPPLAAPLLERLRELRTAKPSISGNDAFHLYETFGLPLDFMVDAARDAGIAFDMEGFEKARAEEQARARASWKGGPQKTASPAFRDLPKTHFDQLRSARHRQKRCGCSCCLCRR
jgi:alanyl-tRNA synthetase